MYNNPYEQYMRNSLGYNGYPMMNMNQMNMNQMNMMNTMPEMYESEGSFMCNHMSVEDMYPEIYRIVYPMICKACMAVNENVTEDLVSRITNEVYMNVEHMEIVGECRNVSSASVNNKTTKNDNINIKPASNSVNEVRQETRKRNPLLNDLIRILVLRELIGNPGRPRPRPPFNPLSRPPFGPGMGPGPRPPFGF